MRQIAVLEREDRAKRFAAYLVTEGISAQTDSDSDGWVIWVRDEDELVRAKEALQIFQTDPENPRYFGVEHAAATLEHEKHVEHEQVRKKVVVVGRQQWRQRIARR